MPFRFNKIDGFIRLSGGEIRHLVLFDYGWFDKICDWVKRLISEKMVSQIVLIITSEKSELIHIKFGTYWKNIDFSKCDNTL